jgi:hypothetical protein
MAVVYFLLLVGLLVIIHELGHFVAAKLLDVRVLRFSIGYGRPLVRFQLGETEYQLAIFPIGGYVRILGVEREEPDPRDVGRSFEARPLWQRIAIVFAGPVANFLLSGVVYFALFAGHRELPAAVIGDVLPDGPAARAGLEPGDKILAINGETVRYWEDVERAVQRAPGKELHLPPPAQRPHRREVPGADREGGASARRLEPGPGLERHHPPAVRADRRRARSALAGRPRRHADRRPGGQRRRAGGRQLDRCRAPPRQVGAPHQPGLHARHRGAGHPAAAPARRALCRSRAQDLARRHAQAHHVHRPRARRDGGGSRRPGLAGRRGRVARRRSGNRPSTARRWITGSISSSGC